MLSYDMAFSTLISTAALGMHLGDPAFAIVDCRYKLDDESWGEHEYMNLHMPGAEYAHLGHDLAGPKTGTNGRHPLPDPKTLADTFGGLGIESGGPGGAPRPSSRTRSDARGRPFRRAWHRERRAGGRLRSGQRHVREPPVVAVALARAR